MEWWVKKVQSSKQTQDYCAVLQSAHLMVIAEITTRQCALQCGDKLTPLANALYCLNDNPALTLKVIKATHFSSERWAEIAKSD
ncbi:MULTISPECIES: histidine kinase [Raoultella]|jgi:signal transduction protein PmrD|uniref:Histidine kinase n=1 Tax=Raoultella planticola TaxID=575 RepID=A0A443VJA7_RAOPL|nr:histidine kinase [Raoultella planticola]MDU3155860.1 histidine kinase [Hafnia alvei]ATM04712.1 histidine kinase [Raoultella planticola]ATM18082.1 histidine kinase [Raoultella planticola]AUU07008.1 histidine kinase [Raoultella planticola]EJR0223100.1 histidine kinase [Raoultella planticola]